MIEVIRFRDSSGVEPLTQWLAGMKDKLVRTRILRRLSYLELGNFGDSAPVGEGVSELRVHVGAGYRVYYARHGNALVLLLCGGDKSSQPNDIKQARRYWAQWKKAQQS